MLPIFWLLVMLFASAAQSDPQPPEYNPELSAPKEPLDRLRERQSLAENLMNSAQEEIELEEQVRHLQEKISQNKIAYCSRAQELCAHVGPQRQDDGNHQPTNHGPNACNRPCATGEETFKLRSELKKKEVLLRDCQRQIKDQNKEIAGLIRECDAEKQEYLQGEVQSGTSDPLLQEQKDEIKVLTNKVKRLQRDNELLRKRLAAQIEPHQTSWYLDFAYAFQQRAIKVFDWSVCFCGNYVVPFLKDLAEWANPSHSNDAGVFED